MKNNIFEKIEVYFPTMIEADYAINYLQDKIRESDRHFASVMDLISCSGYRSVSYKFAYLTDEEVGNWGWSIIDGYSMNRDIVTKSVILTMPPAKRMYYPLTPPPQPVIGPKVVYPKSKYMDYILNNSRKDGKSMKSTMDICKEICGTKTTGPMYMPLTIPSREEIIKDICVFRDYNIDRDQTIITMKYENKLTDLTVFEEYALDSKSRILCDVDYFDMWRDARREEMVSAVTKAYENKKKEQEKEKLKMFLDNSSAVYDKIYKYANNFTIESKPGTWDVATIECPTYNLNLLLGLAGSKKPEPIGYVKIANIEMYNDRVVKVTFDDGSFTKSVCQENDIFDLDVGITVCLMKKMLDDGKGNGTRIYNDIIRDAHKLINDKENEKIEKQTEKEKRKKKAHKAMMKKQAKKMKVKEEAIDIQKQAFVRALQETGMTGDVE